MKFNKYIRNKITYRLEILAISMKLKSNEGITSCLDDDTLMDFNNLTLNNMEPRGLI